MLETKLKKEILKEFGSRAYEESYKKALEIIEEKAHAQKGIVGLEIVAGEILEFIEKEPTEKERLRSIYRKCLGLLSSIGYEEFAQEILELIEVTGIAICPNCFKEIFSFVKSYFVGNILFHTHCYNEIKDDYLLRNNQTKELGGGGNST